MRSLVFGCFILLVATQYSCVGQSKNIYKPSKADRVIKCIEKLGEDRSLIGRHKVCSEIYKQKD